MSQDRPLDGSRLIFVGGAPRSGTTLVQNMLDTHPEIAGAPEFLHVPDIVALGDAMVASAERGWIDLICTSQEVIERTRDLIRGYLIPFLDRSGAKFLSEKTPANVLVFHRLLELFPGARFIHVVRDPRGTVASLLKVGGRARRKGVEPVPYTAGVHEAVAYVRRCLKAGVEAERAAPRRVHRVVYERLVADPRRETLALCGFLDVAWHEAMTRPGNFAHPGAAAITDRSDAVWYDKASFYSNPHTDSVSQWRDTLLPHELVVIRRALRGWSELVTLGYDLSDLGGHSLPWLMRGHLRHGVHRLRGALERKLHPHP